MSLAAAAHLPAREQVDVEALDRMLQLQACVLECRIGCLGGTQHLRSIVRGAWGRGEKWAGQARNMRTLESATGLLLVVGRSQGRVIQAYQPQVREHAPQSAGERRWASTPAGGSLSLQLKEASLATVVTAASSVTAVHFGQLPCQSCRCQLPSMPPSSAPPSLPLHSPFPPSPPSSPVILPPHLVKANLFPRLPCRCLASNRQLIHHLHRSCLTRRLLGG